MGGAGFVGAFGSLMVVIVLMRASLAWAEFPAVAAVSASESAAQNAATTSRLELTDFQGRVDCISDGPGQTLEILQVIGGR